MDHYDDDVKHKHHGQLIYAALESAFPDCEVQHKQKYPDILGDTFLVYQPGKGTPSGKLLVDRDFLEDSRPDSTVERAAVRAADIMRANPGDGVRICYGPEAEILVGVAN